MCEQVAGTLKSLDDGPVVAAARVWVFRERIKLGHFISSSAGGRSAESGAEPARPSRRRLVTQFEHLTPTFKHSALHNVGTTDYLATQNGAVRCAAGPRSLELYCYTVLIPQVRQ